MATQMSKEMKVSCDTRAVELSDDILFEILSWLPAKSICRFKCCSKSFVNITKAKDFAQKQSQHWLLRDDSFFFIHEFFFRSLTSNAEIHTLLPSSSSTIGIPSNFLDFLDENLASIIASSNGLVLCKIQEAIFLNGPMQLFICNHITGSCSFIPSPIPHGFEENSSVIFSFECNKKDENYTLYALGRDDSLPSCSLVCKMYIPKEGLWKERGTRFLLRQKYMLPFQLPVFYKGALHFIIEDQEKRLSYLASYNVESGASKIFEAPHRSTGNLCIFRWGKIGSKKESICWVELYNYGRYFSVWVLSDYESSSGGWSNILSNVSLEELGLNEKYYLVTGFTVMNGYSLVFVTNRGEVYDYDLSGKRKTRLAKVCDHNFRLGAYLTLISYSGTFHSCGIDSTTLY